MPAGHDKNLHACGLPHSMSKRDAFLQRLPIGYLSSRTQDGMPGIVCESACRSDRCLRDGQTGDSPMWTAAPASCSLLLLSNDARALSPWRSAQGLRYGPSTTHPVCRGGPTRCRAPLPQERCAMRIVDNRERAGRLIEPGPAPRVRAEHADPDFAVDVADGDRVLAIDAVEEATDLVSHWMVRHRQQEGMQQSQQKLVVRRSSLVSACHLVSCGSARISGGTR
jgi:hypothetical protein